MFFEKFPLLLYTLDNNRTVQTVPDILRRAVLSNELKNNGSIRIKKIDDKKYCCFHGRHRMCMIKYLYNDNTVLTVKNNKVYNITHM